MRYGLPYKGSKNSIAEWIVDMLPAANCFCDLFCGGGAVTHKAILSKKYDSFIINDIDSRLPNLISECIKSDCKIDPHSKWITRDEFKNRKKEDVYTAIVYSFANNLTDYLYGKNIEDFKHAFHEAVFNDSDALKKYGIELIQSNGNIYEKYLDYASQIRNTEYKSLARLEHVARMKRIEDFSLSMNGECKLTSFGIDYADIPIPKDALIYCDIPYKNTNCGNYNGFDHEHFYDWADAQDNIYISEYNMPDNFIPYAWIEKMVLSNAKAVGRTTEKIYINRKIYNKLSDFDKCRIKLSFPELFKG